MNPLDSCTLLYVEDDPSLRQEMTAFLALHCARVIPAANGHEALELADDDELDLVLTDIRMPEMDGLTLTAQLRAHHPGLPVVLYTAFTDVQTLIRGIELGVAGFVQKPTDAARMIATLERAALPVLQRRQIAALNRELQSTLTRLALASGTNPGTTSAANDAARLPPAALPLSMDEVEKWALQRALTAARGKRMEAARLLGMNYYTFRRHLDRHGLASGNDG